MYLILTSGSVAATLAKIRVTRYDVTCKYMSQFGLMKNRKPRERSDEAGQAKWGREGKGRKGEEMKRGETK